jgi:hypothetical protein
MPRNRYTKIVHKEVRARIAAQEKELAEIARRLRTENAPVTAGTGDDLKERRRLRLEQKKLHEPTRNAAASDTVMPSSSALIAGAA